VGIRDIDDAGRDAAGIQIVHHAPVDENLDWHIAAGAEPGLPAALVAETEAKEGVIAQPALCRHQFAKLASAVDDVLFDPIGDADGLFNAARHDSQKLWPVFRRRGQYAAMNIDPRFDAVLLPDQCGLAFDDADAHHVRWPADGDFGFGDGRAFLQLQPNGLGIDFQNVAFRDSGKTEDFAGIEIAGAAHGDAAHDENIRAEHHDCDQAKRGDQQAAHIAPVDGIQADAVLRILRNRLQRRVASYDDGFAFRAGAFCGAAGTGSAHERETSESDGYNQTGS